MGIIRKYKGLHQLLKSMPILKNSGQSIHLVVAGDFWEPVDEYKELITRFELSKNVTLFPSYIPNEQFHYSFPLQTFSLRPIQQELRAVWLNSQWGLIYPY